MEEIEVKNLVPVKGLEYLEESNRRTVALHCIKGPLGCLCRVLCEPREGVSAPDSLGCRGMVKEGF